MGLELRDTGFHYSVLSEFRDRLLKQGAEGRLFEKMLSCIREHGLVKTGGLQRSDSTSVIANIRKLNRLEMVGQTLHHALNTLAEVEGEWLKVISSVEWFERYSKRFENQHLPDAESKRQQLARQIGEDGWLLYHLIYQTPDKIYLRFLPAIETLRQVWLAQYCWYEEQLIWRDLKEQGLPLGSKVAKAR